MTPNTIRNGIMHKKNIRSFVVITMLKYMTYP